MSEKIYPQFDQANNTVAVTEKWGPGWHVKYIPMPNGQVVILELDGEAPPFVLMAQSAATTAGSAADSR